MPEEIKTRLEEIESRKAQIAEELEGADADLDALDAEARGLVDEETKLNDQLEEIRKAAVAEEEARTAVANGDGETKETIESEGKTMTLEEIRSSKEYIDAYVTLIKTGKDEECRSLLTENASSGGQVPVPTLVDDIVRHAWENENILSRTRKTNFKGNVKVAFERSADGAYIHGEGTSAPTEEALTLGVVEIKPENIKKWITLSDEMLETTGEGFLRYVYEELAYQVMKKLSAEVVGDITAASTSHSGSAVGLPKVNMNPGLSTIPTATANLSDEAQNLCVVMNRLTEVEFHTAYAAGNFAVDPFQGLPRVYTSALPAYSTADTNATYAVVGDLSACQVNFPDGEGLKTVYDNLSLAEKDLVKIVGRVYAGHEITAPGRLVRLTKKAAETTT